MFLRYWALSILVSKLNVNGHVTIRFSIGRFLWVLLWNQASISLTVSEIFSGEFDAVVDMTLNL